MELKKIVVTGGPCGGKTEAKRWIDRIGNELGYTVLFIPEVATEFISGGVAPWTCGTNLEYQIVQSELQLKFEELFLRAAKGMPKDKILMVCDRGFMDNKAYMTDEEYQAVLDYFHLTTQNVLDSYDGVFHLVSAGKGLAECYQLETNSARIETADEAAILDDKILECWKGHPTHIIINNNINFEAKMENLAEEIKTFLLK